MVAGEGEAVTQAPANIGKGLSHKLGPLPVWGWVVVGGGVIVLVYLAYSAYQNANGGSNPNLGSFVPGLGGGTPEGSSTGDTGGSSSTPLGPLTNKAWIDSIASQVAASTGLTLSEVELYLGEYTNGQQPVGIPGGATDFNNVVQAALSLGGAPPQDVSPTTPGLSPYSSTGAYLNDLLTWLPSGTSQSIQNEITNLVNGSTTTISQDAANALAKAQSVIGQGPVPLVYSLIPANVTTAQLQSLAASPYVSNIPADPNAAFNAWQGYVRQYVPSLASASSNDLLYLYNQINLSFQGGSASSPYSGSSGSANLANFINTQILPNLGKLPTQTNVIKYGGIVGQVTTVPVAS